MNQARRKLIDQVIEMMSNTKGILEEVQSEEQDAYDNMPESLQSGERGEQSSSWLDALQTMIDAIEEFEGFEP